jgi:hypothetical protein
LALLVVATLALAACSRGNETRRVETDGPRPSEVDAQAFALAREASYDSASAGTQRVTPDGLTLTLQAQYHEPLRAADWTAPDECAFNTTVDTTVDGVPFSSVPFEGPTREDEPEQAGFVGGVVPVTVPATGEPARLVLVVGFEQGAVLTVEPVAPAPDRGWSPVDSQPTDGWSPLGVLVPEGDGPVDVELTTQAPDGQVTAATVSVPPADGATLHVLTEDWRFDTTAVGPQCEPPPDAAPLNPPTEIDPGGQPTAPTPGEQPDDPAAETARVLEAIRIVYDIGDVYDRAKVEHLERPDEAAVILEEIREQRVVEPFIPQLDPRFDSVVFTSPTEASVLYRVGPSYAWELGRVMQVDGTWRVALGTLCRDLADAFYRCPNVTPDPPPSPLGTPIDWGPNEG